MPCKIDRIARKYDLAPAAPGYEDVDAYLLARWTGEDGRPAAGYRTLTEWFNRRLLKRVYDAHDRETLGARLDAEYEALTGEDDLRRREVADDLRADGIDAGEVLADMPSWSTMRHHLTGCLGGEKDVSGSGWERESVRIARRQAREKVEEALGSLATKGDLPGGGEANVAVTVQVACPHCPTRVPFEDALERGYVCADHRPDGGGETPDPKAGEAPGSGNG